MFRQNSPTEWSYSQEVTWFWLLVVGIIILFLLITPMLIWRRRFLGYVSVWCVLFMAGLAVLWIRNWNGFEDISISDNVFNANKFDSILFSVGSAGGGISLHYGDARFHGKTLQHLHESPLTSHWQRQSNLTENLREHPYPNFAERPGPGQWLYLKRWGFCLTTVNETDVPDGLTFAHFYGIVVPIWFVMLLCTIFPAIWFRKFLRHRYRLRHNLCPTCGYDLRASKGKCPECGAAIPEPASNVASTSK